MSLDPSWAPQESSADLWNEITHFVGETVLSGFSYGILSTLYILTLDALIPQLRSRTHRSWALFHITYITFILILTGAGTASDARLAQRYWINNRNFPGGVSEMINTVHFPELVWGWAVYVVVSWLQDGYVVYRCLVFWNWNLWICGLPMLAFLGSIGTSIVLLISTNTNGLFAPLTLNLAICWYVLSISINVLATLFIVSRLLYKRRTINHILGEEHSRTYTGVVTMLIESAAVYSVVGLVFIGTYFRRSPAGNVILPFLGNLEGICPIMIIYRVAIGRGWTHKTLRQMNTTGVESALRFNNTFNSRSRNTGTVDDETENKSVSGGTSQGTGFGGGGGRKSRQSKNRDRDIELQLGWGGVRGLRGNMGGLDVGGICESELEAGTGMSMGSGGTGDDYSTSMDRSIKLKE